MRIFIKFFMVVMMIGLAKTASAETAHDFSFTSIDGTPLPLSQFSGKAVLVVNTASACGFTPQYDDLQTLYDDYKDQGLVVLGVPSNDFGGQEPLLADGIKNFCEVNFNITFPLTDKASVRGDDAHPFYQWAAQELGALGKPRWNFHKYLIDPNGMLVQWFATPTSPTSSKVKSAVEKALKD